MRSSRVMVTGASSGLGRALAIEFARAGARVALAARREPELRGVAAEARAAGGEGIPIVVDVRDAGAAGEAVRRAERELGGLDLVVANAGKGDTKIGTLLRWEDVEPMVDLNVRGTMATLLAAVPIFVAQQRGHLVAVTSLAGSRGLPASAAYCASKAALSRFLESLRIDLAPAGVLVTDVQPGFVATPAHDGTSYPKPFMWPADRAARHIVRRLEHAPPVLAFPWPLVLATRLGRLLPAWLYDRIVRAQSPTSA